MDSIQVRFFQKTFWPKFSDLTGSCIESISRAGDVMETLEMVWKDIRGAKGYSVSTFGDVRNASTNNIIKPQITKNGILYVPLFVGGEKVARSVKVLVAKAFVPGRTKVFDTAINLDGDKRNNRSDNLVWRPRWHAVKYSRQFLPQNPYPHGKKGPVQEVVEGDIFENIIEAGITNGVLFRDVFSSCRTAAPVFPTKQVFEFVDSIQVHQ